MVLYQNFDLMIYFYIYAFLGWVGETILFYVWKGKYRNHGFLNEPLILMYGFDMIFLIIGSGVSQSYPVFQFIINVFRVFFVRMLCTFFKERTLRVPFSMSNMRGREKNYYLSMLFWDVCVATITFTTFKILHPFIFLAISFLPVILVKILCGILFTVVFADWILVSYMTRKSVKSVINEGKSWQEKMREEKLTLGYRLTDRFHRRIEREYPSLYKYTEDYEGLLQTDRIAARKGIIFARGICLDKLIWVFLITALLGDGIETVFVRIVGGTWMRRSGVVFGPFSIVWGIGAALLTIILFRFADRKLHIFLGGFFLGGTYEYMASVILEAVFHTKFWDYSKIPLNIGGRTNVPYMVGWGVLSLFWVCVCYPIMSRYIEKIPPVAGKVITWTLMAAMALDLAVTGAVMLRYNMRKKHPEAKNAIEKYLDTYYTDKEVKQMWPNIIHSKKK